MYHITGFANAELNTLYTQNNNELIGGQQTFWSSDGLLFMYFQATKCLWQISPRWEPVDDGSGFMDLFQDAQNGGSKGLAMQVNEAVWREWQGDEWRELELSIRHLSQQGDSARLPGAHTAPDPNHPHLLNRVMNGMMAVAPPKLQQQEQPQQRQKHRAAVQESGAGTSGGRGHKDKEGLGSNGNQSSLSKKARRSSHQDSTAKKSILQQVPGTPDDDQ